MNTMKQKWLSFINIFSLLFVAFIYCQYTYAAGPPPASVTVAQVISQPHTQWQTFTGRLQAEKSVQLRPRVSGYIEQVAFKEGELVKKGDLLFKIDDRQLRIEVERLKALLGSAQAQLDLAVRNMDRASSLKETNAISQTLLETRGTHLIKSRTDYNNVSATLKKAQLSLSFTKVTAPISGRASLANITEGNYVSAGENILTTLVSTEKVHAYFDVDEQTFIGLSNVDITQAKAKIQLSGEDIFTDEGVVDFVDNQINISTGTIPLRAVFENTENRYTPGMFVRIKIKVAEPKPTIFIDEKAVGTDLSHKYVLLLSEGNKVEYRAVKLGGREGALRIITSGLSSGESIVVKGLQRARPGSPVSPTEVDMHAIDVPLLAKTPESLSVQK